MWERFLIIIFFMAVMWVGRSQLVELSSKFADSTLQRLEGASIGGSHGSAWVPPYQAGGLTGLGVTQTVKQRAAEIPRINGQTPTAVAVAAWRKYRGAS